MKEKMDPLTDQINVEILSDKCFNLFLKQVQQWYEVNGDRESLTLTGLIIRSKQKLNQKVVIHFNSKMCLAKVISSSRNILFQMSAQGLIFM